MKRIVLNISQEHAEALLAFIKANPIEEIIINKLEKKLDKLIKKHSLEVTSKDISLPDTQNSPHVLDSQESVKPQQGVDSLRDNDSPADTFSSPFEIKGGEES